MHSVSLRVTSAAVTAVALSALALPAVSGAATIPVAAGAVNATADGQCSLIEAINNANTDSTGGSTDCVAGSGADTLVLAGLSNYAIAARDNTFFGYTGLPVITSAITVAGNGSTISRDPTAPSLRLLAVDASGKLTLEDTVLSNGLARGGDGGDDAATDDGGGGGGGAGLGGAILNRGTLSITRGTFTANVARGGDGGDGGSNAAGDDGGGAGGGGLGGNGGTSSPTATFDGGDGGGGWGGTGGVGGFLAGAGGGGTTGDGGNGGGSSGGPGGVQNGGAGGDDGFAGQAGGLGGGGGGGGFEQSGGDGGLGGGGGGGGELGANPVFPSGGDGGFGGGGGGGGEDSSGGDGGFGGGGGASHNQGVVITTGSGGFGGGDAGATSGESGGGGGGAGMGGAIFNDGGSVVVLNSTFSSNSAEGGTGGVGTPGIGQPGQPGSGLGGGIFSRNGSVAVTEATFADNTGQGGGIYVRQDLAQNALLTLRNSIAANTTAGSPDCVLSGTVATSASVTNLVEQNSGCGGVSVTGDPLLGALANNGGLTATLLPAIGSPAVNAASSEACTRTDQRGEPRPVGPACDIGSVEIAPRVARTVGLTYKAKKRAFTGTVKSDALQCLAGRVSVFERRRGPDRKVAKGLINGATGKYVARERDPDGRYYAKLGELQVGEITCLGVKSKSKRVG
jgi:hypothetical protein